MIIKLKNDKNLPLHKLWPVINQYEFYSVKYIIWEKYKLGIDDYCISDIIQLKNRITQLIRFKS